MTAHLKTRINARLDKRLARKVSLVQKRTQKTLSTIIQESLERYCDIELQQGTLYEALIPSGLAGCAEGPVDLSSSYKMTLAEGLEKKY